MKQEHQPKGTFAILIIFLVATILSWIGIYVIMLQRGGL